MTNFDIFNSKAVEETLSKLGKQWKQPGYVEHFDARTVDDAISLLQRYQGGARIIAGGIDVITLMKSRVTLPQALINIKTIPGLAYIDSDAECLKIGPLTTIHDIEISEDIRNTYPMLAEAAHSVAAPQIRNMATIGGNLCQQVRCWYYRRSPATGRSFHCLRKGGEECYAFAGDNRYHAIIDNKECCAVSPSDMAPALIALSATVNIASHIEDRIVPLEELYTPMGNVLQSDEIITEIRVPAPVPGARQRYLKFRVRKTIDFALSNVGLTLTEEAGVVRHARIVLGGVAPTPYRAVAAEESLRGKPLEERIALTAAEAAVSEALPLSMNRYKVHITRSLVKKAIIE